MRGMPDGLDDLLRCDFLCGADPVFVGLHRYETTTDARSYRSEAHTVYDFHQMHRPKAQREITVALPQQIGPMTVIHELGHVLHARLGWRWDAQPVSEYAATNRFEAFAEAFLAWCQPHHAKRPDAATFDYFDRVAAGELR
jgi:hypothetical protein